MRFIRPWNWRGVVGMKAKARMFGRQGWLKGGTFLGMVFSIKLKPKRLAKCRKGPFGSIGFRGLESSVMHFAWGGAAAFT